MNQNRLDRVAEFKDFYDSSKDIFDKFKRNDKSWQELEPYYSFYIISGGRFGHDNDRMVELFFGKRAYDFQKRGTDSESLIEHGATLQYQRNDDGNVAIILYPAKSENQHMTEEMFFISQRMDPKKLKSVRLYRHWLLLMALMEFSSLDGSPSTRQKLLVWYLRTFKNRVIAKTWYSTRIYKFRDEVIKYVLTVGLSGIIISLTLRYIDSRKENAVEKELKEIKKEIIKRGHI